MFPLAHRNSNATHKVLIHENSSPCELSAIIQSQVPDTVQIGQRIGMHSVSYFVIGLANYHGFFFKCLFALTLISLDQKIGMFGPNSAMSSNSLII